MNLAYNLEVSAYFFLRSTICPPCRRRDSICATERSDQPNRTGILIMGVNPGDHVGRCAQNSADWIAFYCVFKAGAVALKLCDALTRGELAMLVNQAQPSFVFTAAAKLHELVALRCSAGLEKIICPGGELDLEQLKAT